MKYLQHMTNCAQDPKIQAVIEEFGTQGYAAYWLILERIAADFDGDKNREFLKLPTKVWQKITNFSQKKLKTFLNFCKKISLLDFSEESNYTTVIVPNLLKYGDEYSKRHAAKMAKKKADLSGQSPSASPSPSPSPSPIQREKLSTGYISIRDGEIIEFPRAVKK